MLILMPWCIHFPNMNKIEKTKNILKSSELFPLKTHCYHIKAAICKTMLRIPVAIQLQKITFYSPLFIKNQGEIQF